MSLLSTTWALGKFWAIYLAFIPYIANFITPITVFIATVFVTSKMAGHTEIIAILSSGVSFRRMMVPFYGRRRHYRHPQLYP